MEDILLLSKKLGLQPGQFIRKNEKDFKENNLEKVIHDKKKWLNPYLNFLR